MQKTDDTGLESSRMSAPLPLFDTIEAPPPTFAFSSQNLWELYT